MFAYNTIIVLAGTTLLGALAGMLGCFLVLRRRALLGDALAHAALPGLCLAFMILGTRQFTGLLIGALISAVLGAWSASAIVRHTRVKEDAAIGLVLSVFFGLGIVLSRIAQNSTSSGNKAGLDSFILGKTAGMLAQDVGVILGVGLAVLLALVLLYKEFKLLAFDGAFARVQGWPVLALDMGLMGLVCVTTIIGLPAVGIVLMAALLIIPAAAARFWTERFGAMLVLSAAIGALTGFSGTLASAHWPRVPAGPVIILTAAALFTISMLASPRRGLLARLVRQRALARRIARQNLLRTLYELSEAHWPRSPRIGIGELLAERAWNARAAAALLRDAEREGWVVPDRAPEPAAAAAGWRLSPEGWRQAAQVVRAHRLWEIFLLEEARVAPAYVDRDAEQIEHVLPRPLLERLERRLLELNLVPPALEAMPASPHPTAAARHSGGPA